MMTTTGESPLFSQLGLTAESFRVSGGQVAASMLTNSLTYIANPAVSLELRIDIARMISKWQEKATAANKLVGFQQSYSKLLETIHQLMREPQNHQLALYLTQALAKESAIMPISSYGTSALSQFINFFQTVCRECAQFDTAGPEDIIIDIVKLLVECFPNTGPTDQLDTIVTTLFQLFYRLDAASPLKACIAHKLCRIFQAEQAANTTSPKNTPKAITAITLLEAHLVSVLHAIRQGHTELIPLVLADATLCSLKSSNLETNLPTMVESIGFGSFESLILQLVDVEPRKLIPTLPVLVTELGNTQVSPREKVSILGVLLTMIQSLGAASVVPLLEQLGEVCKNIPELYIPLFKVITSVSVVSKEDVTIQALVLVSTIAKNAYYKTPSIQAAVLDCVNILKDQCKYSNLFHTDTLQVFEAFGQHNRSVYKNIILWNSGKSARKGNNADFLLHAGTVLPNNNSTPTRGIRSWFGSPKRKSNSGSASNSNVTSPTHTGNSNYQAVVRGPERAFLTPGLQTLHSPTTHNPFPTSLYIPQSPYNSPSKGNSVAPSPHSQNLALMQQQLYAQQQQLQHQMLLVQQMQMQEQLAMFQTTSGDSNTDGKGAGATAIANQLHQQSNLLPPNIYIPPSATTTPYPQSPFAYSTHNPYVLGVQSVNQTTVPLNMSLPLPQSPSDAQQIYSPDSYLHSPVNNVYNRNYTPARNGDVQAKSSGRLLSDLGNKSK